MERKKVNSIEEIWDGKKLIIKDFSNLNLEGLDLSKIPKRAWKDCIFDNTSFKNTGIKFKLKELKYIHTRRPYVKNFNLIMNCDFSGNDLKKIFKDIKNLDIEFVSCNFTDTNISDYIYGVNNTLDKSCEYYKSNYPHSGLDYNTVVNSPYLNLDNGTILGFINDIYYSVPKEEGIRLFKQLLEHKDGTDLKRMYNKLKKVMTDEEIFMAFSEREIYNKHFQKIYLSFKDLNVLDLIDFCACKFDKVVIDDEPSILFDNVFPYYRFVYYNYIDKIVFPKLEYNAWRFNDIDNRLISNITFRTNLYLELGRMCNAKCEFCRNSYYCDYKYDYDAILKTLHQVIPKLDSVVIGGGEPTLVLKDLKRLINEIKDDLEKNNVDLYLFTNGSCKYIDDDLSSLSTKVNYNVSRHAVNDEENAAIFKLPSKKIMSSEELKWFMYQNPKTTLAATCFKGGLDSKQKIIDYIKYAGSMGCESILFSDLIVMEDELLKTKENYNFNIESKVFEDVILYLENKGYKKSIPIYATGGYVLTMLKKGDINISFKHYISKKELEENWPIAIKRTFDLSIDPNGNLYENWHQTSGLVKSIKKK